MLFRRAGTKSLHVVVLASVRQKKLIRSSKIISSVKTYPHQSQDGKSARQISQLWSFGMTSSSS